MIDIKVEGFIDFSTVTIRLLNYFDQLDKSNPFYERNVIALDKETKKIKWVVNYKPAMFVSLTKEDNGMLTGITYDGDICEIDIETGKATRVSWTK